MNEVAKMVAQSCSTCSKAMRAEGVKVLPFVYSVFHAWSCFLLGFRMPMFKTECISTYKTVAPLRQWTIKVFATLVFSRPLPPPPRPKPPKVILTLA